MQSLSRVYDRQLWPGLLHELHQSMLLLLLLLLRLQVLGWRSQLLRIKRSLLLCLLLSRIWLHVELQCCVLQTFDKRRAHTSTTSKPDFVLWIALHESF